MNIRRFTDKDRRTVMNRVREELGPDAVVLSSKTLADGFSMVVATDYDADQFDQAASANNTGGRSRPIPKPSTPKSTLGKPATSEVSALDDGIIHLSRFESQSVGVNQSQQQIRSVSADEPINAILGNQKSAPHGTSAHASNTPSIRQIERPDADLQKKSQNEVENKLETQRLDNLQAELANLRSFLEQELPKVKEVRNKALVQQAPKIASVDILRDKMERFGLSEALTLGLLNQIGRVTDSAKGWRQVMTLLRNQIRIPAIGPLEQGGVFALVGPSGSGKTTTLCKLAARYVMQGGRKNLAIISMDTQRFGAQEQIKRFAECLRIPVEIVQKVEDLPSALDKFADKKLVLIDAATPGSGPGAGISSGNSPIGALLTSFRNCGRRVDSLLTIPATQSAMVLENLAASIEKHLIAGVVLTKLDECLSLAPVIDLIVQNHWPVCFTTSGHKVPQDIENAEADQLMRLAVQMSKSSRPEKAILNRALPGAKSSSDEIAAMMEQSS